LAGGATADWNEARLEKNQEITYDAVGNSRSQIFIFPFNSSSPLVIIRVEKPKSSCTYNIKFIITQYLSYDN